MAPIEIEYNTGKTNRIEPGMLVKAVSRRMGDQRLALTFFCAPDDSSGYVKSGLLQVNTRYKLGPLKIGEKRKAERPETTNLLKDGKQFRLSLEGNNILTATFRSKK